MERYLTFSHWCKEHYGRRLYRAALSAGMTCPNRDGTIDTRGCIFCLGGSGDFSVAYEGKRMNKEDLVFNHREAEPGDYIAYFQSYTNTYAPVERLRFLFESALEDPLFAGISVATRPDCINEETAALFKELRQKYPEKLIMAELGLQTIHESSALWMRRGYSLPVFEKCLELLHEADVNITVHVIIGLPGETKEMMYETVRYLNNCGIDGVKLQLLHYLKGTDLGYLYEKDPDSFHVLTLEEYTEIIAECIGILNPDIVIHRLTGDGNGEALLAPLWSKDKRHVLNMIRHELKIRNIVQGCLSND
ncbi:MAG: TIGR01212 family radical SAM protein [Solobacterium sp.]|nr:TIGR01212 family radical SAM protein [Solobacterium sp.]